MRTTLHLLVAVLALAALAPARAAATGGWQLRAGAEYAQSDTWAPSGEHDKLPRLQLDLGLVAGGAIVAPGIVDWNATAAYQRAAVNGNDSVQDRLSYGLRSTLLGSPSGPLTLTGYATRRDDQFSTEGASAGSLLGRGYGGDFVLRGGGAKPSLTGRYDYAKDDADSLALGKTERSIQSVGAATVFGSSAFSYNASYRGAFSDGTFETDRYDDHRIDVNASSNVAADTSVRLGSSFYTRTTPQLTAINARQEAESIQASVIRSPLGGLQQSGTYTYGRSLQQTLGTDLERVQHRASYAAGGQLPNPEWALRGSLDGGYEEDRRGTEIARNASQSGTVAVTWRRASADSSTDVGAGPSIGVNEPDHGDAQLGWGAFASVAHSRSGSIQTSFGYSAGFTDNVGPEQGWAFRQAVNGNLGMRMGLASLQATLQGAAERRQSALYGAAASRSLTGIGLWRLRKTDVQLAVGYQDGTAGSLTSGAADALFIAPAYDSRSAYAQGTVTTALSVFVASGRVRYTSTSLPDRPAYSETQVGGAVDYAYGALRIGISDTYVVTDVYGGQLRVNQFLVRAYRAFGSRF